MTVFPPANVDFFQLTVLYMKSALLAEGIEIIEEIRAIVNPNFYRLPDFDLLFSKDSAVSVALIVFSGSNLMTESQLQQEGNLLHCFVLKLYQQMLDLRTRSQLLC